MCEKIKTYQWTEKITSLYMMIMFLAFPLYYQNNYINMLEAKTALFVPVTAGYLIIGAVSIVIVRLYANKQGQNKGNGQRGTKPASAPLDIHKFMLQDVFFALFLIAVVLTIIAADDFNTVWEAPECKMFGAKIILLCCGIYVISSRGYFFNKAVKLTLIIGIGAVLTLTVLNRYGIDPLDMYSNLVEQQKHKYMSTIGNANILANFICIFIPLIMGLYMYAEDKAGKVIYGILVYIGVMAGVATNSDSFFLGFGAAVIFLLWFAMDSREKLCGYLSMGAIGAFAMFSLKLFNDLSSFAYKWNSLQLDLIYNIPWLIITVGLVVAVALLYRTGKEIPLKKIRNILFAVLGAGLVIFVIFVIRVNTGMVVTQSKYLTFSDEWGTNRGFAWSRTWEVFTNLPFSQQFTGIGPGEFRDFFETFNYQRAAMGLPAFVDPHSEVLYYLVATGFLGMIGYFGMIIAALVKCVKVRHRETIIMAVIFVSWLAQGLVNNPLVFVTPYIFLALGISRYAVKKTL